ncbi:hypothetical protein HELRODRAFT_62454, partial [Helobdella robusta]|uniref:DH domain-containing protein n=1 Tax=Helobdella robusta TaxID=6412 RepID=T1FX08_HELRO
YVLDELMDTENKYIQDLTLIVEGYMTLVKDSDIVKPPSLKDQKEAMVFGNVHQILDWHENTLKAEIERCIHDPQHLASVFIKYEKRFLMYVKYCENKPKSEDIVFENLDYFEVSSFFMPLGTVYISHITYLAFKTNLTFAQQLREKLGERLQLADMLIKPVQRIMKYQLLFKDILKYTERAGDDIRDIQKALEGKVTSQGRLLLQDTLEIAELPSSSSSSTSLTNLKFQKRKVFLFEQIIIFSEQPVVKNASNSSCNKNGPSLSGPSYIYKHDIKVIKYIFV